MYKRAFIYIAICISILLIGVFELRPPSNDTVSPADSQAKDDSGPMVGLTHEHVARGKDAPSGSEVSPPPSITPPDKEISDALDKVLATKPLLGISREELAACVTAFVDEKERWRTLTNLRAEIEVKPAGTKNAKSDQGSLKGTLEMHVVDTPKEKIEEGKKPWTYVMTITGENGTWSYSSDGTEESLVIEAPDEETKAIVQRLLSPRMPDLITLPRAVTSLQESTDAARELLGPGAEDEWQPERFFQWWVPQRGYVYGKGNSSYIFAHPEKMPPIEVVFKDGRFSEIADNTPNLPNYRVTFKEYQGVDSFQFPSEMVMEQEGRQDVALTFQGVEIIRGSAGR